MRIPVIQILAVILGIAACAGGYVIYRYVTVATPLNRHEFSTPTVCTVLVTDFEGRRTGVMYIKDGNYRIDMEYRAGNEGIYLHEIAFLDSYYYSWLDISNQGFRSAAASEEILNLFSEGDVQCSPWWSASDRPFIVPSNIIFPEE